MEYNQPADNYEQSPISHRPPTDVEMELNSIMKGEHEYSEAYYNRLGSHNKEHPYAVRYVAELFGQLGAERKELGEVVTLDPGVENYDSEDNRKHAEAQQDLADAWRRNNPSLADDPAYAHLNGMNLDQPKAKASETLDNAGYFELSGTEWVPTQKWKDEFGTKP